MSLNNFLVKEKSYSGVLCESCKAIRKAKCYQCNEPAVANKDFAVKICLSCVSSKRLKCLKCSKGIMAIYHNAYYC